MYNEMNKKEYHRQWRNTENTGRYNEVLPVGAIKTIVKVLVAGNVLKIKSLI